MTVEDIRSGIESRGTGMQLIINGLEFSFEFAVSQFVIVGPGKIIFSNHLIGLYTAGRVWCSQSETILI